MTATSVAGTTPLVSIALCTYNGALYLREQLDSLTAQHEVAFEIVAVDDGSQDQTCAILHDHAARDPRIRCFANDRNLGPTASFERAMSLCRGDFIAPCDQDDLWHPDKLARLLAAIGTCDAAYCDSDYVDAQGQTLHRRISDARTMLSGTTPASFLFTNSVSGHATLLRRELFELARPFPHGVYHDWWLALCAAGRNGIRYLDEPLVHFRRHGDAYSSMGQWDIGMRRQTSREWLDQRQALMRAYSGTGLRDCEIARTLADALRCAIDQGHNGALMRLLWNQRRALPCRTGIAMVDALRFQLRVLRKLKRARSTPAGDGMRGD